MKNNKRITRLFILVSLAVALVFSGTTNASAVGELPCEIHGNGNDFAFNTKTGKVSIPNCTLEAAYAFRTSWDITDSFYSSGEYVNIFEHLKEAHVSSMPKLQEGLYSTYEYAGLELWVRSTKDKSITARIRLTPRNRDDYDAYQDIVDLEMVIFVNYDQEGEDSYVKEYQLESYNLWNEVVEYTMEHYNPSILEKATRIEYHTLQNDPGAPATPSKNPPTLRDLSKIKTIANILASAQKLEHDMTGSDYMHLRFVNSNGQQVSVYLIAPKDKSVDYIYARMGGYCYLVKKDVIQKALYDAGIPWEMMI